MGSMGASCLRALASYPDCPEFSFPGPPWSISRHSCVFLTRWPLLHLGCCCLSSDTIFLSWTIENTPWWDIWFFVTHVLLPQFVLHFAERASENAVLTLLSFLTVFSDLCRLWDLIHLSKAGVQKPHSPLPLSFHSNSYFVTQSCFHFFTNAPVLIKLGMDVRKVRKCMWWV